MMKLYDAHAHLGTEEERKIRREYGMTTMVCAGTAKEAEALLAETRADASLVPAVGLHPWHCEECTVEAMLPFLEVV